MKFHKNVFGYFLWSPICRQVFYMMACIFDSTASGFHYGLASIITTDNSTTRIDTKDGSLITSALAMTVLPSALVTSFVIDKYGRKAAFILLTIPGSLSFITLYFSRNISELIVGRLLAGLSIGALLFLSGVIVGEYTSPKLRPTLITIKLATLNFGILLSHILGSILHWRHISLVGLVINVVGFSIALTWPESPSWLAKEGRFEQCTETFHWLRGHDKDSIKELDDMINKWKQHVKTETTTKEKFVNFLRKLTQKSFLMPSFIMLCIYIVRETGGKNSIPSYAIQIVSSITGDKENVFLYILAMDSVIVFSNLLASSITSKVNRRTLLFGGGGLAVFLLLSMCLSLYLSYKEILASSASIVSLCLLLMYVFVLQTCVSSATSTLIGEIFPLEHRSLGIIVNGAISSLCLVTSMYTMPKLLALFDIYGTFSIFAIFLIILLSILYKILPETNNKTLQEIESNFYDK